MIGYQPKLRIVSAWPSSCTRIETNTTAIQMTTNCGGRMLSPIITAASQNIGWTRTGTPSAWKRKSYGVAGVGSRVTDYCSEKLNELAQRRRKSRAAGSDEDQLSIRSAAAATKCAKKQ